MSSDPKHIQIKLEAIAKMVKYDISHAGKETAGLLIGEEKDGIVYVDDIRVGDQKGNAVHVEISEEELTHAVIDVSERTDGKVIVGWWHTHPNLSSFLSPTDIKTQLNYQALMPNAIAIVIDPVKYSKTMKLENLDFKVFRVEDGKAKQFNYYTTGSVEFGLNTFVKEGSVEVSKPGPRLIRAPVLSENHLKQMKYSLANVSEKLDEPNRVALETWIEFASALQSGDIKEVPIDVESIISKIDNSMEKIDDTLISIEDELLNWKATKAFFAMSLGLLIEAILFYLFI